MSSDFKVRYTSPLKGLYCSLVLPLVSWVWFSLAWDSHTATDSAAILEQVQRHYYPMPEMCWISFTQYMAILQFSIGFSAPTDRIEWTTTWIFSETSSTVLQTRLRSFPPCRTRSIPLPFWYIHMGAANYIVWIIRFITWLNDVLAVI